MEKKELKHIAILLVVGAIFFSSTLFIDYPFLKSNHQPKFYVYNNYYIPKTENKLIITSYKPKRPYMAPRDSSMQSTIKVNLAKAQVSAGSSSEVEQSQAITISNGMERRNENVSSGINGGGTLAIGRKSSSGSGIDNGASGGISSGSTGTSLFSQSTSTSQTGPYAPNQGGTDPGGDPLKPRIPVGNELGVLLSLIAAYAAFKKFKKQ